MYRNDTSKLGGKIVTKTTTHPGTLSGVKKENHSDQIKNLIEDYRKNFPRV